MKQMSDGKPSYDGHMEGANLQPSKLDHAMSGNKVDMSILA